MYLFGEGNWGGHDGGAGPRARASTDRPTGWVTIRKAPNNEQSMQQDDWCNTAGLQGSRTLLPTGTAGWPVAGWCCPLTWVRGVGVSGRVPTGASAGSTSVATSRRSGLIVCRRAGRNASLQMLMGRVSFVTFCALV